MFFRVSAAPSTAEEMSPLVIDGAEMHIAFRLVARRREPDGSDRDFVVRIPERPLLLAGGPIIGDFPIFDRR